MSAEPFKKGDRIRSTAWQPDRFWTVQQVNWPWVAGVVDVGDYRFQIDDASKDVWQLFEPLPEEK